VDYPFPCHAGRSKIESWDRSPRQSDEKHRMKWRYPILAGFLAAGVAWADVPVTSLRPLTPRSVETPTGELQVFPELLQVAVQQSMPQRERADKLQPSSRLELIRYVAGEFARAVNPLPAGKKGYHQEAGKPLDEQALRRATGAAGTAANPGDQVQITKLEFHSNEIWVDINGGGRKKKSWKDRISIGVGGGGSGPGMRTSQTNDQASGPGGFQGLGSTIILDYGKAIPDLTPDELKQHLSGFVDFSKQRSAAVHWIDTLPPEIKQAISDKRAVVGMDREMVIAAIGKPERKVREKDLDGLETEDWIYGHPPSETIFVKFAGDKVIAVREFPH